MKILEKARHLHTKEENAFNYEAFFALFLIHKRTKITTKNERKEYQLTLYGSVFILMKKERKEVKSRQKVYFHCLKPALFHQFYNKRVIVQKRDE